ncbi:toll/interleukin-1 receptor domain-containing protein [Cochleicola gelatinilyticus]|uniref:TIR domain-containing protein n=1 Tax=Cochleicola gelatinilyticus TaxID=1763537 RepID=A0A167GWQ0_9FLAO|nr:toll/interleukin-1 receptor domain-containing protein [Cochleicola gelatinilyticus]OAB77984.1 hypothetical protein ULVI_10875 [Cochleicola gelatinilyticus]
MATENTIFFSYSRENSEFVLQLAQDLRKAGATIWLDQLDITPGSRWDSSIEKALNSSGRLLVVLSCESVVSHNVLDEVSYALEENKVVVPVLLERCDIPFRLRRLQYADFTGDYMKGIKTLTSALHLDSQTASKLEKVAQHTHPNISPQKSNPIKPEVVNEPISSSFQQTTGTPQHTVYPKLPPKKDYTLWYVLGALFLVFMVAIFFFFILGAMIEDPVYYDDY